MSLLPDDLIGEQGILYFEDVLKLRGKFTLRLAAYSPTGPGGGVGTNQSSVCISKRLFLGSGRDIPQQEDLFTFQKIYMNL